MAVQPASVDRLLRCPGVRAVLGMEMRSGAPIRHAGRAMDNVEEAWRHTQVLAPLLTRAQAAAADLLEAGDALTLLSVRTRLEIEYVMAPEGESSDLAVVCTQGPADWTPPAREARYQPLEADCDWLFGAADE